MPVFMFKCGLVEGRDGFKYSMYKVKAKVKAKARPLRGQGQGHDFLSSSPARGRGQSSRTTSLVEGDLKSDGLVQCS